MASEVATAVAQNVVPRRKLRIKVLAKKPVKGACGFSEPSGVNCLNKPLTDGNSNTVVGGKKLKLTLGTDHVIRTCQISKQVPKPNWFEKLSGNDNRTTTVIVNTKLNSLVGCKRRSEEVLEGHEGKRMKMDGLVTSNCQTILEKLMAHEFSFPFYSPVKPDAWGLDDYFEIIKKPMDLGTIQKKLLQKKYIDTVEFEADVRLTFSNAMSYNPPGNWVHQYAKELVRVFDTLWKPFKKKVDRKYKDMKPRGSEISHSKGAYDVTRKCLLNNSACLDQLPGIAMMRKERGSKDLKKLSVEGKHCDLKSVKDIKPKETLSSKSHSDSTGTISRLHKQSACPMSAKVKCENAPTKKSAVDDFNAVKVKSTSTLERASFGQDSDGALSLVSKERGLASVGATTGSPIATSKGLETLLDVELSSSKALRVASMKRRFAGIILKAQHHALLEPDNGIDAAIWQEKERLQKKQLEEKARIKAQIRDFESAARFKKESELRRQRNQAREEARMAIKKMERSVDFVDNLQVLKDLEAMIGSSLVVARHDRRSRATPWSQMDSNKHKSPLERLGLYLKEEYRVGDDDDYAFLEEDWEEGEVIF